MPPDLHCLSADGWTDPHDGGIRIRPLAPAQDVPLLHRWFRLPYATFWGMQHLPEEDTFAFYEQLTGSGHANAWIGLVDGGRAFLVECYDPAHDVLAEHYAVRPGDLGMHFFVGPADAPVRGFTRRVFRSIMHFMFVRLRAQRIVVEPDVRNHKVRVLNDAMGFVHEREIQLAHKRAGLALCTPAAFQLATQKEVLA
jgi:RimJ/RimL family protein N-acetyltransferase